MPASSRRMYAVHVHDSLKELQYTFRRRRHDIHHPTEHVLLQSLTATDSANMTNSVITTDLFLALIVLTSSILILILVYILVRLVNRKKAKACQHQHQDLESRLLDLDDGRQSRLSQRISRQQIQQEHYEDLQQRYSSVPPSPSIELLPEIKTSSSDERASEWLERGNVDEGVDVVSGDLGEKKPEVHPALVVKPKKQLRWDWRDGKMDNGDGSPKIIESTDKDGMVCTEYDVEKPKSGGGA
jgi:hypothetical protein